MQQERERIEAVRRGLVAEKGGDDVSSNEWAMAAGISRRKLDEILWDGRESENRITSCYHGLVVSIASSYLGRGLSLQDLAQVSSISAFLKLITVVNYSLNLDLAGRKHRPSSRCDQIRSR